MDFLVTMSENLGYPRKVDGWSWLFPNKTAVYSICGQFYIHHQLNPWSPLFRWSKLNITYLLPWISHDFHSWWQNRQNPIFLVGENPMAPAWGQLSAASHRSTWQSVISLWSPHLLRRKFQFVLAWRFGLVVWKSGNSSFMIYEPIFLIYSYII